MRILLLVQGLIFLMLSSCEDAYNRYDDEITIPDFNFPQSVDFEPSLSAYGIYDGNPAALQPTSDYHLLELSSTLFTDYAHKQRLVSVPSGSQISKNGDDAIDFPNGSILVKTFYYFNNEQQPNEGKRIIETRLLIKQNDIWNASTYLWNEQQTDATLQVDGFNILVCWSNDSGQRISTNYEVPKANACGTCHQSNASMTPLGPTLRNLNKMVERNGVSVNQINHLQSLGLLEAFPHNSISNIVDYKDINLSLQDRARAYLAMNCAHCHNPTGWQEANLQRFDFNYETPLTQTGILNRREKISRTITNGRMPFIGTTLLDKEGLHLITDYLNTL